MTPPPVEAAVLALLTVIAVVQVTGTPWWKSWRTYCHNRTAFLEESDDRVATLADKSLWRMSRLATARRNHGNELVCWRESHAISPHTGRVFKFYTNEYEQVWYRDDLRAAGVSI